MVKYSVINKNKKRIRFKDLKAGEFFSFTDSFAVRLKLDDDSWIVSDSMICLDDTFYSDESWIYPLNAEINLSYVYEGEDE